jgi:uncharacterized protein involved in exopolysaccharide biosynthesis
LLSACITILATAAVSLRLPNRFTSEAKILILEQQIPQSVTGTFSTTSVADKLQIITQEILSRARLVGIADQFGLYSRNRGQLTDEQLAGLMVKAIDIQPVDQLPGRFTFNAFSISFTSDTPELAQQITRTLASLFIESNLKTQQNQATNTADLLKEQVNRKRQQIAELEQRRREVETQYLEVEPEQQGAQGANEFGLQELRIQLQSATGSLNRARQQRLYLESVLSSTLGGSLARLQSEKSALLLRFTQEHPAVAKKDQEIARVEALLNAQKSGAAGRDELEITSDDPTLGQLRGQLRANSQEIADLSKDEERLKVSIAEGENRLRASAAASHLRVGAAPARRQQLAAIDREFEILTREIADLEQKQQQSGLVADMERREQGQQFRQIDPASLPTGPSSPNRLKINLGGAGAGIALGLALAFLMDIKAHSFYTEKQLSQRFAVPFTIGLPVLFTLGEKRNLKWKLTFEWLAGSILTMAALMAEYYVFRQG